MKILMLRGHNLKTKMVTMRKKGRRNLKNKVMGLIIVKRTTKDKKNNNKKKIMKKTNMKNKYKQIQILRKIINQLMVVSL